VNDNIIVAAEGEMADFQEMQTILSDMVQEQEDLRDYLDVCDVRPQQAQHFMSQVVYFFKPKPSAINHTP
jgi:20S proteasome alpha/beta subunit